MIVGFGFAEGWDDLIRFLWAQPFGETEPLYGHDIAFYLFDLPFLDRIQNTVALLAFAATAALLVIYVRAGLVAYRPGLGIVAPRSVLHHLLANAALFLLAWASGYILDRYELLTESTGAVFGAGYTAVHVTSWALWAAALLTVGFVVLAYAVVAAGQARRLAVLAGGFVAAMFLILVVLPVSVQRFVVLPNELALEEPYLRRDIAFTRKAFGLAAVEVRAYEPSATLDMAAIEANRDTINNIRLWDWQPLKQTFRQLQQIRSYYTFEDVDVDRYRVGDGQRQVLLSARELSRDLPGKGITWVNRRLQYTHGYGLVMAPAADKTPDGRPVFIIADIPPVAPPSLGVTQPAIYYGEEDSGYRIVNTSVPEFDYPSGDENVYTSYKGHGDVVLDSWLKRLVYAWQQFDINILISDYVRADSRIQLWRQIQTRIAKIAPFLTLDHNPYLVVDGGRLFWIQDAYTTGERFPYAEPTASGVSYIRNSVKIVVDAYEGDVTFYAVDPQDPVLRVYQAAFPHLFQPIQAMPAGLVAHLRYPQDLFAIQAQKYATYHMTEPHVFYNSEDLWQNPRAKEGDRQVAVEPYYVLIRMPGEAAPGVPAADADDPRQARQHDRLAGGAFGPAPLRPARRLHAAQGPAGPGTGPDRRDDRPGHHDLAPAHALGPAWLAGDPRPPAGDPDRQGVPLRRARVSARRRTTRSRSCSGSSSATARGPPWNRRCAARSRPSSGAGPRARSPAASRGLSSRLPSFRQPATLLRRSSRHFAKATGRRSGARCSG